MTTDLVLLEGYQPGESLTVEAVREGLVIGRVTAQADATGSLLINHPPDAPGAALVCWEGWTPDLLAKDRVRVIDATGVDFTDVRDLFILPSSSPIGAPGSSPVIEGNVLTIHGHARGLDGSPLPAVQLEVRIFKGNRADWVGTDRRRLAAIPTVNPDGTFVARFEVTEQDIADVRASGLDQVIEFLLPNPDPTIEEAPEMTIYEEPGEETLECPPVARVGTVAVTPNPIGIAGAANVTIQGVAPAGSSVSVLVTDRLGAAAGPFEGTASPGGTWTLTGVALGELASGELTVSMTATPPGGLPTPGRPFIATLDLIPPELVALSLNGGAAFTTHREVRVELTAVDPSPSTPPLGVALAESPLELEGAAFQPVGVLSFSLSGDEGPKTVCARLRDGAGNRSADLCQGIVLDSTPPAFAGPAPAPGSSVVPPLASATVMASDANGLVAASLSATVDGLPAPASLVGEQISVSPVGGFASGEHRVAVSIQDTAGNQGAFGWFFTVGEPLPRVAIFSPVEGAIFNAGTTVDIQANANDESGIRQVAFFVDGVLIRTDTAPRFHALWTARSGRHALAATATDNTGQQASHSVSVCVRLSDGSGCGPIIGDAPPTVAITNPAEGAILREGSALTIQANASDDRQVVQVEFFANSTRLATDTTAPYQVTRTAVRGRWTLTATAVDSGGQRTSHSVNVCVAASDGSGCGPVGTDAPPTVAITSPAGGAVILEGASVTIQANASDDRQVAQVEFFANNTRLATDTTAPYQVTRTAVRGRWTLTATAVDSSGQRTSHSVNVCVAASDGSGCSP
ncbi:MAG: Ig-like domain-containing protein [Myxococcales bacterium]|nr:Ig-like domain-containing protein [Myxococcales bacterium]